MADTLSSTDTSKAGGRIAVLDSLRGAAALMVLWHHLFVIFPEDVLGLKALGNEAYQIGRWLSDQNKNAVLLFFVLSGFAIRLAVRSSRPMSAPELAHYARKRAFRILPLYWLALGWTAVLGWFVFGASDRSFSTWTLAGNLAFLQTSAWASGNWFPPYGLNGPLWSLSYEAFYYAFLPIALVAGTRIGGVKGCLHLLVAGSLACSLLAIGINAAWPTPFTHFLAYWHVWVLGYALADAWANNARTPYAPISFVIVSIATLAAQALGFSSDTLRTLLDGVGLAAIAYLTVLIASWRSTRLLATAGSAILHVFHWIGRGSYALYLLHYPLLLAIHAILGQTAIVGVARASAIGAIIALFALLLCPLLERGLGHLGSRLLRQAPRPRYS